ncbi:uncharacterized protein PHALS_03986 [Plasmopara halstedii]|uniref:Uncharacterized protein n=1 Tax=Plasmopara halstedii TaxID=4781 RepID=A0A0P1A8X9_PLAHL|nr:uncharacterized protein PHALS_03986 [Plasmopara halstedii]CEG36735.1 hypothetical protein PHALS_03986 [Plasmopara halstedii]|eukprot:XP_024573104.1 hypothetical protein PHALS_03986 [Plasmopara halstedii]
MPFELPLISHRSFTLPMTAASYLVNVLIVNVAGYNRLLKRLVENEPSTHMSNNISAKGNHILSLPLTRVT